MKRMVFAAAALLLALCVAGLFRRGARQLPSIFFP